MLVNTDYDDRDEIPMLIPVNGPPEEPGFGAWGAVLWSLAFFGVLLLTFTVGMVGDLVIEAQQHADKEAFFKRAFDLDEKLEKVPPELASALRSGFLWGEVGSVLFALVLLRGKLGGGWRRKVALRLPSFESGVLAVLCVPAFIIASGLIGAAAESVFGAIAGEGEVDTGKMINELLGAWPLWLSVLVIGVGPGIGEELFCRGFLGRSLVGNYGYVGGILGTSVLFGLMHGPSPAYIATTFFMGVFLHLIYLATGSLMVSMFVHFANNSIATLLMLGAVDMKFLDTDNGLPPAGVIVAGLLLFAASAYAFYVGRVRLADTGEPGPIWRPDFPGAALPPERSSTVAVQETTMGVPMGMVVLAFGLFVLSCYLEA